MQQTTSFEIQNQLNVPLTLNTATFTSGAASGSVLNFAANTSDAIGLWCAGTSFRFASR